MSEKFQIIALGRAEKTDEDFRSYVSENLNIFSRKKEVSDPKTQQFLSHITYHSLDIDKEESYIGLNEKINNFDLAFGERANRLFYLSITPSFISTISSNIMQNKTV
jgi:glucose-6-phosphate 1-dehydrogenase